MTCEAGRRQGGYLLPLQGFEGEIGYQFDQTDDREAAPDLGN